MGSTSASGGRTSWPSLPIGFAHRGARAECQDNTIASFRRALELGARALESDVWLSADGVAVLDHDGVLRRRLRREPIRAVPRDRLPAHIPTLAELYQCCGADFELSLDVKDPDAAAEAITAAAAVGAESRLWLCGSGARLASWRSLSPQVHLVCSTTTSRLAGGVAAAAGRLAGEGVDALNLRWPEWDAADVDAVHDAGLLALAWDAERHATIRALLSLGIDGLYSDHVGVMTAALEGWRSAPR